MTETTTILEKAGIGGYEEYRIPAIAVTDKGTVLTAWESRKETGNDWAECISPSGEVRMMEKVSANLSI